MSEAQRSQLEALVPKKDPLPQNVVDISRYFPDRVLRRPPDGSPPEPDEPVPPPPSRWHWSTARTAAFVVLTTAAFGIYWLNQPTSDYVTGIGERRVIHLDDGSMLTMNTQSRVKVWFTHHQRDLQLVDGEALFTVAHDATRPFRVHVGRSVVEAVGTEFDVLRDQHGTKVSVVEGRVKIFDYQSPAPLILNPNAVAWTETGATESQQAGTPVPVRAREVATVTQPVGTAANFEVDRREVTQQEIERYLAWTNGQLIFENTTLAETIEEFNRYNRRKLRIGDADIAKLRIGGAFRSNNVDDLLMELHSLFGIRAVPLGSTDAGTVVIQLKHERPGPP